MSAAEFSIESEHLLSKVVPVKDGIVYVETIIENNSMMGFCGINWTQKIGTDPIKITTDCTFAALKKASGSYPGAEYLRYRTNSINTYTTVFGVVKDQDHLNT